jgi:integrase
MLEHIRGNRNSVLSGPVLVDDDGVPRFWSLVWAIYQPMVAKSTLQKKLRYVDAFYKHAQEIAESRLDSAIAGLDVEQLSSLLQGYYTHIGNSAPITPASQYKWSSATKFISDLADLRLHISSSRDENDKLRVKIAELKMINQPLYASRQASPTRLRALPYQVIEYLYGLLDPTSKTNPFHRPRTIWNAWILFLLFLHESLRRGEVLSQRSDGIWHGFDRNRQHERFWIRVKTNPYEEDPRYSAPSLKNVFAIRTLPIAQNIALAVEEYKSNYRGMPNHSFLINSSWDTPLSTETVTHIFRTISSALPSHIRTLLRNHTDCESITPHDLRHTCAVLRLNQFLKLGIDRQTATENLRVLFGWEKDSTMPLLYARAAFESSLADVWRKDFDDRVELLRALTTEPAFPEAPEVGAQRVAPMTKDQ